MDRRNFIKTGAIAGLGAVLRNSVFGALFAENTSETVAAFPSLSAEELLSLERNLKSVAINDGLLHMRLGEVRHNVEGLQKVGQGILSKAEEQRRILHAMRNDKNVFEDSLKRLQESMEEIRPYKDQLPHLIAEGKVQLPTQDEIVFSQYSSAETAPEIVANSLNGYYVEAEKIYDGLRANVADIAKRNFDWDIESQNWNEDWQEKLAKPFRLHEFVEKMHENRAYAILSKDGHYGEGPNQIIIDAPPLTEEQIASNKSTMRIRIIERGFQGWRKRSNLYANEEMADLKKMLDEGVVPGITGTKSLGPHRLALTIDYTKPEAQEAIAFLQQFEPQRANLLSEMASVSETQPMLPAQMRWLRTPPQPDGYSK